MNKFLVSNLLALGLFVATVTACAQESEVVDYDYDQQDKSATTTPPPAEKSSPPITPPARPASTNEVKAPAGAATVGQKDGAAPTSYKDKDGTIVVVGEPAPKATTPHPPDDQELDDLFSLQADDSPPVDKAPQPPVDPKAAESSLDNMSKSGAEEPSAPGLKVSSPPLPPSKPQDIEEKAKEKIEVIKVVPTKPQNEVVGAPKSRASKPAKKAGKKISRSAVAAKPSAVQYPPLSDDFYIRRWTLATRNWSRVRPTGQAQPKSMVAGRSLYPINQAGPPITPIRTGSAPTKRR